MRTILCCDGGGGLGILPAKFIANHPSLIKDADMYAGTSTGGLLMLGLASGLAPMEIVRFYRDRCPQIFRRAKWATLWPLFRERYSEKPLEAALREILGDKTLADLPKDKRILITATDYNRERAENALFFFRNESPYTLFDAARATSAAPTYFKPYILGNRALMDGGLVSNNPADCALAEAISWWGTGERIHLISFGCGLQPPDPPTRVTRAPWTFLDDVISIGIGGGIGRVDTLLREVADGFKDWVTYDRYDFMLDRSIAMDDARPETLAYLESRAADCYVTLNGKPLMAKVQAA